METTAPASEPPAASPPVRKWVTMKQMPPDGDWQAYVKANVGNMSYMAPPDHIWEVGFNDGTYERMDNDALMAMLENRAPKPLLVGEDKTKQMVDQSLKNVEICQKISIENNKELAEMNAKIEERKAAKEAEAAKEADAAKEAEAHAAVAG
uniref:Uncharacterized protein n=1 Tax=Haptolina brevifila TaxID=156173 RepID=A0A7S2J6Q9_9EUKA|mmetsp:Transcript_77064/g.152955  ORF Transcript_77064/g.152955 Transcript_77064/m.152955 type:complete len:151 (+) Transcript_77064:69-521(+)|eukprot:CAMPEP_0174716302 /NCGR_PEP_ID=MMETSP1094-20130205/23656_1 /TAXON_ID=156173 /ORGANISM="Chrysochromulina brevifilum, Strain UTEX LB 985" /LENGTH=150 /DNA_ID=CAMNT_0015916015 /DNA_START=68 /DNA_END=520 /DNA_ORIENTATION=-